MNEQTNIIEAEIVPETNTKLVKLTADSGLEKTATETLFDAFRPVFIRSKSALAAAAGVAESVKDATCVKEIKQSRACRLAIRAVRLEGEATHKKQKESALRFGRAVDGFKNILLADLEPVEKALQDAEDTAERAEAARLAALKLDRENELRPLVEVLPPGNLAELKKEDFDRLVADAKLLRQAKLDAAAKLEAERLAKEKADREERARLDAENARLKAEALAREAEAKRAAEEAEKKLATERAEAARVAAEIKAKADAENARLAEIARKEREAAAKEQERLRAELAAKEKAEADEKARIQAEKLATERAAKKAAAAPDKAKLTALAGTIDAIALPKLSDPQLSAAVAERFGSLSGFLTNTANNL